MKLALCIGINDYPGTENDLAGCRNDAEDWADELTARGFDTRRLIDSAASGAAIRAGIRALLTTATTGDAVVITYSGHGTWVPDTGGDEPDHRDEALCPHDIAENGPLLDDELHDLFALAAPGVRTVLISDSCHSGTLTRLNSPIGDHPARARFLPPSTFLTPRQHLRATRLSASARHVLAPGGAPGTPGSAFGTPGTPGTPGSAAGSTPGAPGSTPGTPSSTLGTTRTPGTPGSAPGTPGSAPGTPGSAPGTTGTPSSTLGTTRTPGTPGSAAGTPSSTPGTTGTPSSTPGTTRTPGTPSSTLGTTRTPGTPGSASGTPGGARGAVRPKAADPRPTALLLAGCGDAEYSYDATFDGRPNGAFTYVALAALTGLPPTATYRDWMHAIRATLPSQDYPQTPALLATKAQLAWPLLA